jgi:hypothetical protein
MPLAKDSLLVCNLQATAKSAASMQRAVDGALRTVSSGRHIQKTAEVDSRACVLLTKHASPTIVSDMDRSCARSGRAGGFWLIYNSRLAHPVQ